MSFLGNLFGKAKTAESAVVAKVEAEATPAHVLNIFDAMIGTLKTRSAGHPILLDAETWIQKEVDAHGAALIAEAESAVLAILAPKLALLGITIPVSLLPAVPLVAAAVVASPVIVSSPPKPVVSAVTAASKQASSPTSGS